MEGQLLLVLFFSSHPSPVGLHEFRTSLCCNRTSVDAETEQASSAPVEIFGNLLEGKEGSEQESFRLLPSESNFARRYHCGHARDSKAFRAHSPGWVRLKHP